MELVHCQVSKSLCAVSPIGKSQGKEVEWMDSIGKEVSTWQKMLDTPNFWIEETLPLRPTMAGRHKPH